MSEVNMNENNQESLATQKARQSLQVEDPVHPLIDIRDVEVNYGNIRALKGISLQVPSGNICSLIGANGSGKSTLLKAIVGLEPLVKGEIRFDGHLICSSGRGGRNLPTDQIVQRGIALVPEGRRVFGDMTVEENLDMGAFLVRDPDRIKVKKQQMYALFPILEKRCRQKAGQLSGGEQQMLAIARALMNSPKLLLLDEPGLGLAPLIIKLIFDTITRINRDEGVTIFLVEQNARMALQASTTGSVLETGSIVLQDSSKALLEDPRVRAAYLGE
jgi:branched-chain amino acid transport system ATP-binding protein